MVYRRSYKSTSLRRRGEPARQAQRRPDFGDARAAALLRGRDRHAAPVRLSAGRAIARKAHDAALAGDGLDPRHTQLRGLLDDPVHLVRLGQALHEPQQEGRLAARIAVRADFHVHAVPVDALDRGVVLAAAAIEHDEGVAGLQPQGLGNVLGGVGIEGELRARTEPQVAMDSRDRHGANA